MRPRGISQIVRVRMLSTAVLMVVTGAGLHLGNGVAQTQGQGHGQRNGNPKPPPTLQNGPTMLPAMDQPASMGDPLHTHMDEERMKAMNEDRQKRLSADVERLLLLTNELKAGLDKTNKDQLSLEVMRKAAEIEKLAHDVQSRMKN